MFERVEHVEHVEPVEKYLHVKNRKMSLGISLNTVSATLSIEIWCFCFFSFSQYFPTGKPIKAALRITGKFTE